MVRWLTATVLIYTRVAIYSGSPVLVYRTPGYDLEEPPAKELAKANILLAGTNFLGLLGIHFAQFPEKWELVSNLSPVAADVHDVPLVREGAYVKGLSGMTCVLPAWHILDVLNLPHLKQARDRGDLKEAERREREGSPPEAEADLTSVQT